MSNNEWGSSGIGRRIWEDFQINEGGGISKMGVEGVLADGRRWVFS